MTTSIKHQVINRDFAKISPIEFGDHLDKRLHVLLGSIEASEAYQSVFASDADPRYIATVVKYVLLDSITTNLDYCCH